jgi:hypothetical protein
MSDSGVRCGWWMGKIPHASCCVLISAAISDLLDSSTIRKDIYTFIECRVSCLKDTESEVRKC